MSLGSQRFAKTISHTINQIGVTCNVYRATQTITVDGNTVPEAVVSAGTAKVFIDRSPEITDEAATLGIMASIVGHAYFRSEDEILVKDRDVLEDDNGQAWLMHSYPNSPRLPNTVGVSCFVTIMKVRPQGMP